MIPWLHNEIADGLTKLVCLRLDNSPPMEMVPGTVAAWVVSLTTGKAWDEQRDRVRVREAFDRLLASGISRWPQPGKLVELLPEPKALRLEGSTRPDPSDPYELAHQRRLAEYAAATDRSTDGADIRNPGA